MPQAPMRTMLLLAILSVTWPVSVLRASSRYACSFDDIPGEPKVATIEYVRSLIHQADLIVRARALRYGQGSHYLVPPDAAGMGGARAIQFQILESLTTRPDVPIVRLIYVGGYLTTKDDFNPDSVPYLFVRREGRRGSCFASVYRRGGEFLLMLKLMPSGYYMPYWALLAPLAEQIRGPNDPWVVWVRQELASENVKHPH